MNDPAAPAAGPDLSPAEARELEAEVRVLIAQLRRAVQRRRPADYDDSGNMGVPHAVFVAGWDGVRLTPPPLE